MQPLLNIKADSSSIYDGLRSKGIETIFETTPQATLTIEDNPFGSSRYSIDTYNTSGEWSFPRAIKENISFYGRTLTKFTFATWFKVVDNSVNQVFSLGFGNNTPYSPFFLMINVTSAKYGYQIGPGDSSFTIASFNRPVSLLGLLICAIFARCCGIPSFPRYNTPSLSQTTRFFTPACSNILQMAPPALPAPFNTSLILSMSLFTTFRAFKSAAVTTMAVPC